MALRKVPTWPQMQTRSSQVVLYQFCGVRDAISKEMAREEVQMVRMVAVEPN